MEHFYALIMAGGGGTRLWPMSRKNSPKQVLALTEDSSLFKSSVNRLAPLFSPDQIYVVTGRQYLDDLRAEAPEIPETHFIAEPYGKNTGPAVALAVAVIHKRDPLATIAILTADHHISQPGRFRQALEAAYDEAQNEWIVTLGIAPTYPATGFGYIHQGEKLTDGPMTTYKALGFKEKPDIDTAVRFQASGEYSWNSGMFIWTAECALSEYSRQQPVLYTLLEQIEAAIGQPDFEVALSAAWENVPTISIDKAIMEGAQRMAVIPADIGWSDVGSWDALYDVLTGDANGNIFRGSGPQPIVVDTHQTLVFSDRLVVTIGIDDLLIVDTDDALLICRKGQSQDVRKVVEQLQDTQQKNYL